MNATSLMLVLALTGPFDSGTNKDKSLATISHCQVFLIEDVEAPALETGELLQIAVKAGQSVKKGQLLAQIDDRRAQLDRTAAESERDAALARAADDIEVRFAIASLEVAAAEYDRNVEINRRSPGSVSLSEITHLRLAKHRAELQVDRSKQDLKIAKMTADVQSTRVAVAEENIARRRIVAPFDGKILDVLRQRAEWVDAGQPVVRIARMDKLRVEGFLSTREYNPEDIEGSRVSVQIERARGRTVTLTGTVVFASPIVQGGDKYRVRAEVDNQREGDHWLVGSGIPAAMTIQLGTR